MKKLMITVLLAAFVIGCTPTSVEEQEYETEIQLIDKEHSRRPGKQGGGCEEKQQQQQQSGDN